MPKPDSAKAIDFGANRDELIRQTAYSNYEARNHVEGHDLLDWLQAETLVNQMPGKVDQSYIAKMAAENGPSNRG
jgi:hypothetical protein